MPTHRLYVPTAAGGAAGSLPPAPRPASLDHTLIGLLWNSKPNGDVYLEAVRELLSTHHDGVRFLERSKPVAARSVPPTTLEDLRDCHCVITALGD